MSISYILHPNRLGGCYTWYEWAKSNHVVAAMSGKVVYTPSGEPVDLQQMMRRYPCECS
ncbi:MAG: hypothetical protein ACHBN1_01270 [Heteroscytonema crispum UTEX LB 1556]